MGIEDFDVLETFAYFGKAMFLAQMTETSIAIHLSGRLDNLKTDLTKDRYDELLTKRTYQTFGQLKSQYYLKANPSEEIKIKLNQAHEYRDWLAHNYWWDRSHEFNHFGKRQEMKIELEKVCELFQELSDLFSQDNKDFLEQEGIDIEEIFRKVAQEKTTPPIIPFQRLTKNEKLKGFYLYKFNEKHSIPIFILEDNSCWTLCESGLTQWRKDVKEENLISIEKITSKCPMEFNPLPKTNGAWNYEIILKSGFSIKIQSVENEGYRYKWNIIKK